jgi:hypothetical protein
VSTAPSIEGARWAADRWCGEVARAPPRPQVTGWWTVSERRATSESEKKSDEARPWRMAEPVTLASATQLQNQSEINEFKSIHSVTDVRNGLNKI